MTTSPIGNQFVSAGDRLPGDAATVALRRAALARFEELALPSRSIETWRYTDFGKLVPQDLSYIAPTIDESTLVAAKQVLDGLDLPADAPRCVFVDGCLVEGLSSLDNSEGLTIDTLAAEPNGLLRADESSDSSLLALNTAFASAGVLLRMSGDIARPVQLVFIGATEGLASQLRLRFVLERNSRADVVANFVDLPDSQGWLNLVTDIDLHEASQLRLHRVQRQAPVRYQTALTRASVAADARFSLALAEVGAKLSRNDVEISLHGSRASADVIGLAITADSQHCDTRIAVDHIAADTRSRQDYRAIAADRSRSVFNGKVTVAKDAQHIEARQRNDNLLLAATAEIDTKPELEIYADQVVCSHGATVGELSEDHLFYLRSRGIGPDQARSILTTAFANVILNQFGLSEVREHARVAVAEALARQSSASGVRR